MAFEKVVPDGLNTAVNLCKNSINYSESFKSLNATTSGNVWQANAKDKLNKSLDRLINTEYQKILKHLDTISSVSNLIANYKELQKENTEYNERIARLEPNLYYWEEETTSYIDLNGEEVQTTEWHQYKDYHIEAEIENLEKEIAKNKEQMKSIENKVSNLID